MDYDFQWKRHIYKDKELKKGEGLLDCGFICKEVEKAVGCDLIVYHDSICYLGKSSHTSGSIGVELFNKTVYLTQGRLLIFKFEQHYISVL